MRLLAEADEQITDGGLRKEPMDQTDESEQILLEQRWKEAHQGFTRMREMVMRQVALSCIRHKMPNIVVVYGAQPSFPL